MPFTTELSNADLNLERRDKTLQTLDSGTPCFPKPVEYPLAAKFGYGLSAILGRFYLIY